MFVCPVCEHSQEQGAECESCGKPLVVTEQKIVAVAALADLEVNQLPSAEHVAAAPLPELELSRFATPAQVQTAPVPEFEGTRMEVGQVAAIVPMVDMEADRPPDDGARTAAPT